MRRAFAVRLIAGAAVLAGAWAAFTQQNNKQAPQPMKLNKIADDLYELEQNGNGNVAIYLTNDGVILVDDKFEQNYDEIMANVKKLSDKPVKYVLNTHQHGDHTGSNAKMIANGVEIFIHKNARANMLKGKQPGVPQIAYADQLQVTLGGKEVDAYYNGRGHTNGNVAIYFPALRVVHTGDLFTTSAGAGAVAPILDYANGASAVEWPKTLDGILKLDFDTVIPGHGALMKRADLEKFRDGFLTMETRVRDMARQNKSRDDISKMLQSDFGWGTLNAGGLDRMMAELK